MPFREFYKRSLYMLMHIYCRVNITVSYLIQFEHCQSTGSLRISPKSYYPEGSKSDLYIKGHKVIKNFKLHDCDVKWFCNFFGKRN